MNDDNAIIVKLGKDEGKFIRALVRFKADVSRFGHAIFSDKTILVTDGYSLALMPRGEFLKGIVSGKVLFGSTPAGASATTLWEIDAPDKRIKDGLESAIQSAFKRKCAVIDIDAYKLVSLLQVILSIAPPNTTTYNTIRIGIPVDEPGEFWGESSPNPILVALTNISREHSPILSMLMPVHSGDKPDNRAHAINALLTHFSEDMSEKKTENSEKE